MKILNIYFALIFTVFSAVMFFFCFSNYVIAQTTGDAVARRAQLEQTLAGLEQEIKAQEAILKEQQNRSISLERDIAILTASIKKAKLSVRARALSIERLSQEINSKKETIEVLDDKINREKDSLAQIMRKTNELDNYSLSEVAFSGKKISQFFEDISAFDSIKESLKDSFVEIETNRIKTTEEKTALEEKRTDESNMKKLQELEQKKIEKQEAEKKLILKQSKGIEAEYQKIIKNKALTAAEIRAELFTLRGSTAIPFEKALEYANIASQKTKIRPAFLLGIIAEESNLGENVGTGTWRVDMKAPRDTVPFLDICNRLGFDPDKMPVSKKAWYGYGGAMGPAQFIPSTWIMYEKRIAATTGHNPPNPWDPEDAFAASAILLTDSGAAKQTVKAERYAALCYLAGCANAGKSAYQFYADDVMDLAAKYQKQIDILKNNN